MYATRPRPDWHWLVRGLAAFAAAVWLVVTLGLPPFAEARLMLDRGQPDTAVRGFLEQAALGRAAGFVDPAVRERPETLIALRGYQPDAFVGEFDRLGQRAADSIAVTVSRVSVESATADRATVVASATYRPQRRERLANFTFLERRFEERYDLVRREGGWYLAGVPTFTARPAAE